MTPSSVSQRKLPNPPPVSPIYCSPFVSLHPMRVQPILTAGSRAERVVQRYRAARRFNIDRERIFSAYLMFGGVRTVLPLSYV